MKTLRRIFTIALIATLSAVLACAGTVTYNASIPFTTTPFGTTPLVPLNFSQFNPINGTLTGVSVTILGTTETNSTGSLTNTGGATSNLSIGIDVFYSFTGVNGVLAPTSFDLVPNVFGPHATLAANQTITWTPTVNGNGTTPGVDATLGTNDVGATLTTGLAPFIGTGTVTALDASTIGNYSGVLPLNYTTTGATQADVFAQITYTYSSGTPEPVSMLLFGSGLLGVALVGRKKFARK
jgi:hypothetical protein